MRKVGVPTDEALDLVVFLAEQSGRPMTWLALTDLPGMAPEDNDWILKRFRPHREQPAHA